jgi:hypothetical protein
LIDAEIKVTLLNNSRDISKELWKISSLFLVVLVPESFLLSNNLHQFYS